MIFTQSFEVSAHLEVMLSHAVIVLHLMGKAAEFGVLYLFSVSHQLCSGPDGIKHFSKCEENQSLWNSSLIWSQLRFSFSVTHNRDTLFRLH